MKFFVLLIVLSQVSFAQVGDVYLEKNTSGTLGLVAVNDLIASQPNLAAVNSVLLANNLSPIQMPNAATFLCTVTQKSIPRVEFSYKNNVTKYISNVVFGNFAEKITTGMIEQFLEQELCQEIDSKGIRYNKLEPATISINSCAEKLSQVYSAKLKYKKASLNCGTYVLKKSSSGLPVSVNTAP
jgi:hypothetical protein